MKAIEWIETAAGVLAEGESNESLVDVLYLLSDQGGDAPVGLTRILVAINASLDAAASHLWEVEGERNPDTSPELEAVASAGYHMREMCKALGVKLG